MKYVRISYDPDLSKIGSVVEVDNRTARQMVRSGRGVVVRKPREKAPAKKAPAKKAAARKRPAKKAAAKGSTVKPAPPTVETHPEPPAAV